uniref:Uncharacterized protein n=1 Tax=Arundo donax TaxID=35708 RepID=A0A0A9EVH6_ARUDO
MLHPVRSRRQYCCRLLSHNSRAWSSHLVRSHPPFSFVHQLASATLQYSRLINLIITTPQCKLYICSLC